MCNWPKWIWPGLVATALLTALTGWFLSGPVENDLATRSGEALKGASMPWATVSFDGRDASVTGIAESDAAKAEAAKSVLDTYGVRVVADGATLPPVAEPFVFTAAKNADGILLKGNYASVADHASFVAAVEKSMPGIAVKDEMTLAGGKPAGFDDLAAFGVSQLADLTVGEVSLSNLDYSIKGDPVDGGTYEKLTAALAAAIPGGGALKSADITAPPVTGPYVFSAKIEGEAVNLEGFAPSEDEKAAIGAKAGEIFSGKTINNLLKVAGGAPQGFGELVSFGLGQLQKLGNGSVSLSDMNYALQGIPADKATFDDLTAGSSSLPAGAKLAGLDIALASAPESEPAPVKPHVWSATTDGVRVALAGDAASEDSANNLLLLVKNRFINAGLSNNQVARDGAPEGFFDAQAGLLRSLSYFSAGKASLEGNKASISGSVASQALADLVGKTAQTRLPQGYDLALDVKVAEPAQVAPAAPAPEVVACVDQVRTVLATGEIRFASGSANIDAKSHALLDQIGATLKTCPASIIEIAGHTDNEGDDAMNLILSDRRANAVRAYLGKLLGSADGLVATGYGETRPVAPNDTAENKAKNRRIEFQAVQ